MAKQVNYLIGQGETLRQSVQVNQGFGDKAHPYEFREAVSRLSTQIEQTINAIDELPDEACPGDEAVVALTLHPSYLAKSYHPKALLTGLGLRQVGSRERRDIVPEKSTRKDPLTITSELFVAGPRAALRALSPNEGLIERSENMQDDFRKIEAIRPLGDERIKGQHLEGKGIPLEVVLHIAGDQDTNFEILTGFENWCESLDADIELITEREVGSLAFWNVRADADVLREMIKFSFVRLLRRMPKLAFRQIDSGAIDPAGSINVDIGQMKPIGTHVRAAIFDGGLPVDHPYGSLANNRTPLGIGAPLAAGLSHGMQVTSAALFGPIEVGKTLPQPFTSVDHWRVVDDTGDDFELTATLDRITNILNQEQYDIANLSLGPDECLDDDDVHVWTATMDKIAAKGQTVIVSAAGNNGLYDAMSGSNRIQPSADGVNVLAVGARNSLSDNWSRAPYSAVGPGRSPGLVKPDCLAFGGTETEPYYAISSSGVATGAIGTSFSAPTVFRLASGLKSTFDRLSATAMKALLLHSAEENGNPQSEVGWGSIRHNIADLVTCADDSATVVYQGMLGLQRHVRYPIPCPAAGFTNRVTMTATFVIASPVDPEDAVSYTQVGAQITFRPQTTGHPGYTEKGAEKLHPSKSFFGQSAMYQNEQELREDAHRWEAVKRSTKRFNADTLDKPVFDIEHLVRLNGAGGTRVSDIPYALIVTIHEKDNENLYDDILSAHTTLSVLAPRIELSI